MRATEVGTKQVFDPRNVHRFRFVAYAFDAATRTARLEYALDNTSDGDLGDGALHFTEEITFPGARVPADPAGRAALDRCLRHLHLAAGVSYYKAAVPPEIVVETGPLAPPTARFFERLYLHGLGEFAHQNGLDLTDRIRFPDDPEAAAKPPAPAGLRRRTAVPVGGGKDSVVTIEALKNAGEPIVLISVGDPEPIREVSRVADVPRIVITRRIAPELLELNRRGALNGHVPISGILAFVLATASLLYGFDAVAMSNERSADEGNLIVAGREINHQYSKSSAFEGDFDALMRASVLPDLRYFSFLRPFSELAITALFSRAPAAYREVFRSCNAAFRLDETKRARRWCGECPKCRFVYLALAPFLKRQELVDIFNWDLLDDPSAEAGFAALLGLGEHKPFECVGTFDESAAALLLLERSPDWRDAALVRRLVERLRRERPALVADPDRQVRDALTPSSADTLPEHFRSMLPELGDLAGDTAGSVTAGDRDAP